MPNSSGYKVYFIVSPAFPEHCLLARGKAQMSAILGHLDQVSIFGRSVVWLVVILGLDWIFSAVHACEEWRGEGVPLWRVFGAVVRLWLPNWLGFLLFTLGLTLILWSAGLLAIAGWFPLVGDVSLPVAIGALGFIIGARISDTLISHWGLYALGYLPNPGLRSTDAGGAGNRSAVAA